MHGKHSGFTLIEVIIVMIVIVILTVLGTVAMSAVQRQAEDSEREQDVKTITRALETYYVKGNPHIVGKNTKGFYPGVNEMAHIFGGNWCSIVTVGYTFDPCDTMEAEYYGEVLPGLNRAAITPPGMTEQRDMTTTIWAWGPPDDVAPRVNQGYYVYKPVARGDSDTTVHHNGTCYDPGACGAYVIFYKKSDGTTVTVRSKHQ